jgi:hypothetical protein
METTYVTTWRAKLDMRRAKGLKAPMYDRVKEVQVYHLGTDLYKAMRDVARLTRLPASYFSFYTRRNKCQTNVKLTMADPYKGAGRYKGD